MIAVIAGHRATSPSSGRQKTLPLMNTDQTDSKQEKKQMRCHAATQPCDAESADEGHSGTAPRHAKGARVGDPGVTQRKSFVSGVDRGVGSPTPPRSRDIAEIRKTKPQRSRRITKESRSLRLDYDFAHEK
jgi:hypothetical protein